VIGLQGSRPEREIVCRKWTRLNAAAATAPWNPSGDIGVIAKQTLVVRKEFSVSAKSVFVVKYRRVEDAVESVSTYTGSGWKRDLRAIVGRVNRPVPVSGLPCEELPKPSNIK
jgi:hypothetical protein